MSIVDGGGGGDSFEGVERVDKAARKLQDDRELRSDDENDGDDATEEETSPTALQVDGGRVAPAVGELTRELFAAVRAKNKDHVRELLDMEADVNAYEPAPEVRARDLRCVSLSPGADRARI